MVYIILCEVEEAVNLMGPECGSWGVPARGTSKRTYCNAFGAMHIPFVSDANHCVGKNLDRMHRQCLKYNHILPGPSSPKPNPFSLRIVLCLFLIMARHGYWVLEQPAQSLLVRSHRFERFINHTCYVP